MFCHKCGGVLADGSEYCPACGTPVQGPGLVPAPVAYPATYAAPPAPPEKTDDKAIISLVLGIFSLLSFSILAGIPAIILGRMSQKNIRASSGRLTGSRLATAGVVMGWISVGLAGVLLLLFVAMVAYVIPGFR
jgi:hypothetical protein